MPVDVAALRAPVPRTSTLLLILVGCMKWERGLTLGMVSCFRAHMHWPSVSVLLVFVAACVNCAFAWGTIGHEIVATIAQALLPLHIRSQLCNNLPNTTAYHAMELSENDTIPIRTNVHCHLAPIANWADQVKHVMPWTSHMHYVNAVADEPPSACHFGTKGFVRESHILTGALHQCVKSVHAFTNISAIPRYANQLPFPAKRTNALRFLTHLIGDMHQPLHLVGRDAGGNAFSVYFERRRTTLHRVWDRDLVYRRIQSLHNYTRELDERDVESALRGRHYDAYIRWILVEGLGIGIKDPARQQRAWWPAWRNWTACPIKPVALGGIADPAPSRIPVCPLSWAHEIHALACQYAFPLDVQKKKPLHLRWLLAQSFLLSPDRTIAPEVAVPTYLHPIDRSLVIEKTLAMAGVRLAALIEWGFTHRTEHESAPLG